MSFLTAVFLEDGSHGFSVVCEDQHLVGGLVYLAMETAASSRYL